MHLALPGKKLLCIIFRKKNLISHLFKYSKYLVVSVEDCSAIDVHFTCSVSSSVLFWFHSSCSWIQYLLQRARKIWICLQKKTNLFLIIKLCTCIQFLRFYIGFMVQFCLVNCLLYYRENWSMIPCIWILNTFASSLFLIIAYNDLSKVVCGIYTSKVH